MSSHSSTGLTLGDLTSLACLLEASAPKVGNVHRSADFADMTLTDFLVSGMGLRRVFDQAAEQSVGELVLAAVKVTRSLVPVNTNLGLILLLAPLAKATQFDSIRAGVGEVLQTLTPHDSQLVYDAIRLASPGGMGEADEMDLAQQAPASLLQAMRAAAERDLIARQYINQFDGVFGLVTDPLANCVAQGHSLTDSIVDTHLHLMSERPDSLIARKCGDKLAQQSALMARRVREAGAIGSEDYLKAAADFDFWLRADGHRRNPGTSADMIGAGLFVAIWEVSVLPPYR